MKTRITVWTLAWDTRTGTNCEVFATEDELEAALARIIQEDISAVSGSDAEEVRKLLAEENVWQAWARWCEEFKDPLDTYCWDSQPLAIELPETEELVAT
jgi:hypothetical protein